MPAQPPQQIKLIAALGELQVITRKSAAPNRDIGRAYIEDKSGQGIDGGDQTEEQSGIGLCPPGGVLVAAGTGNSDHLVGGGEASFDGAQPVFRLGSVGIGGDDDFALGAVHPALAGGADSLLGLADHAYAVACSNSRRVVGAVVVYDDDFVAPVVVLMLQ